MKHAAMLLGVIVLAACAAERSNDGHLRSVSVSNDHAARPDGTVLMMTTVSVSLPEEFPVEKPEGVILIDTAGRRHHPETVNLRQSSESGDELTVKAVVPDGTQVAVLQTSTLDIDVRNSRVTRRAV